MPLSGPEERHATLLRDHLARALVERGAIRSATVESAVRAVPRHRFAPLDTTLESAYADQILVPCQGTDGTPLCAIPAPWTQAELLERAHLRPGHNVLIIGACGYFEALTKHIVGERGQVTAVDANERVAAWAQARLAATDYPATVVHVLPENGVAANAPYDRLIVTLPTPDIPAPWLAQLGPTGVLVAPLSVRQQQRVISFGRNNGHLESRSALDGWSTPLPAASPFEVALDGIAALQFEQDPPQDPMSFSRALEHPRARVATSVRVGADDPHGDLHLFLRASLPTATIVTAQSVASATIDPFTSGSPALVCSDGSFAYLAARATHNGDGAVVHELEVHGHGPSGRDAAELMGQHVEVWARFYRESTGPAIHIYSAQVPDHDLPEGFVVDTPRSRVVLVWSQAGRTRPDQASLSQGGA